MSFARYPAYKNSGVEWLGSVPAHWESARIKALFSAFAQPGSDDLPILSVSIHDGVSDREISEEELERQVSLAAPTPSPARTHH